MCIQIVNSQEKQIYDFTAIDEKIQSWVDKKYYPGASLLIAKDNQIICEKYFGSYKPDTVVYIASAGKWLAAATIAAVVDDGKLSWDDPANKWLPEFTDDKGKATLSQLLSHTSGYPDYQPKGNRRDDYQTLIESVAHIQPLSPAFKPGEQFQYGGLAMQVAGRMAELASGMDWESLFQEKIAKPLGMTDTHFTPVDSGPGHAPMLGGGARCTLQDYGNFLSMISNNGLYKGKRILSEKAISQMQADQVGEAKVNPGEFVEKVRGNKHTGIYGFGEWCEILDDKGDAVLISSPSWAGAYPWIDKTCGVYGFFLTHVDESVANPAGFSAFYSSPVLAVMVRQVILQSLETGFMNPPDFVRPQTYWMWMNGNVTKDGITRDLEAMKRVGIGGAQIYEDTVGIPRGPLDYGSDEWYDTITYAVREADRLGLKLSMHNGPGYSGSSGSWITPDKSMQYLVWSETVVSGPEPVNILLPQPYANMGYYRDAFVLAYPCLPDEEKLMRDALAKVVFNGTEVDKQIFIDGDPQTEMRLAPNDSGGPGEIVLEFIELFGARSIQVHRLPESPRDPFDGPRDYPPRLTLEASDDGINYHQICRISMPALRKLNAPGVQSFPYVKARFFRLLSSDPTRISDVILHPGPRLEGWNVKANFTRTGGSRREMQEEIPSELLIDPARVLDITSQMDANGRLNWNAPEGLWTILRIGHTTTGEESGAAPESCIGLECDKFSSEAIEFHFKHLLEPLLNRLGPLTGKSLVGIVVDSWEAGTQNWTTSFPEEFKKCCGYDIGPYVAAMTGRIVGNIETSEKFLWDVRRTQADMLAENYYGHLRELCHQHGLTLAAEPYGDGPFDTMQVCGNVDLTLGEFWVRNTYGDPDRSRMAGSAAHTYGGNIAAMEAYTGHPLASRWTEYPYALKADGDWMFCNGMNRMIFHTFAHQPHPDVVPGMTMGPFGTHLDRNVTWWNQGTAWIQYLTRVQYMLQQGLFVADLCYLVGESPGMVIPPKRVLNPPEGYSYDVAHREVLLKRMKIQDGRIVLPDGMSYRLLMLPEEKTMSVPVLQKIRELVAEGMLLVGPRPEISPGLSGQPEANETVRQLSQEIWGDIDGINIKEHSYGRGRVFYGKTILDILTEIDLKPDFEYSSARPDTAIHYTHRRIGDTDVYFVANGQRRSEEVVCTFRAADKLPELWNPENGNIQQGVIYECEDGLVRVPLRLDPSGSVFVVFRNQADKSPLRSIAKDGATLKQTTPFAPANSHLYPDIKNNFTVTVWAKPDTVATSGRSFLIFPSDGEELYGAGHATFGCTAGTNGVRVYEQTGRRRQEVLSNNIPLEGWTHLTFVYRDSMPYLYINGIQVARGQRSRWIIHPGLNTPMSDEQFIAYFQGDMSEPTLLPEAIDEDRIAKLAQAGPPLPGSPPAIEITRNRDGQAEALIWQNGHYSFKWTENSFEADVVNVTAPIEISGPWKISFPEGRSAPPEVTLESLESLHKHTDPGVRYFSGTATYLKKFKIPEHVTEDKRLYLDLGRVEVIAEVRVNNRNLGILWKPPYRVDITDAVVPGDNNLEVRVTNLWPNRLIGDEQLPPENDYDTHGFIQKMPDWFTEDRPKTGQRVTFSTWHHYDKAEPLLESGLIGPVRILTAVRLTIQQEI